MSTFPIILINTASVILLIVVILFALKKRTHTGSTELLLTALFMLIWSVGSFAEMFSSDFSHKLLWRNITQIGVFYAPAACLLFSVTYSGTFVKIKKRIAAVVYAVQTVSIVLILTDQWLHLMRLDVGLVQSGSFSSIAVKNTLLGKMLISLNFILMATALVLLIIFTVQTRNKMRKQVLITLAGMSIALVYALLKVSSGEKFMPFLPISGVFSIACLTMLLGIIRYDFLMTLPVARNEVFNVIGEGIVVASTNGEVIDINAAACRIFSNEKVQTENCSKSLSEVNKRIRTAYPDWYNTLALCRPGGLNLTRVTNTATYYYHCDIYVLNKNRKVIGTISVIHDITEQRIQNDLLKQRAERDGLLEIYNRHTFIELVDKDLRQNQSEACLIFFDLDDFKKVNDSFGHIAGDYVLMEVCRCVEKTLDAQGLLGRVGGEEFAVFIKAITRPYALKTAETLKSRIEAHPFIFKGQQIHVTVSIGVAVGSGLNFDQLYQQADDMLYKAKYAGKNCVMV